MKFGKVLQSTVKDYPGKPFFCYKKLKKILKAATSSSKNSGAESETDNDSKDKRLTSYSNFIALLNQDLHRLNDYFIGEEEDMVIRLQSLESALESSKPEEEHQLHRSLIQFHGEVVSLLHWESMNFAAIAKILKKHDKMTVGVSIRQPFLETVSRQPFHSTELVETLATRTENLITQFGPFPKTEQSIYDSISTEKIATAAGAEEDRHKKTLQAIRTWRDLGDNAHTPSTVLPYTKPIPDDMQKLKNRNENRSDSVRRKRVTEVADSESVNKKSKRKG